MRPHHVKKKIEDYQVFSRKLILTTACTVLLSSAVSSFVQSAVGIFAPLVPAWSFSLLEMVLACFGLWWVNRNGKKK